jgi:hypothetical protein
MKNVQLPADRATGIGPGAAAGTSGATKIDPHISKINDLAPPDGRLREAEANPPPRTRGHNHRMGLWIPPLARPMTDSGRRPRAENPPGSADMSNMG